MSIKEGVKAEPCAGAFRDCLVDGNSEQTARQRKIKRRALALSISLQTVGLAALVIAPLFAKPPELVGRNAMPIPPYRPAPAPKRERIFRPIEPNHQVCVPCALASQPAIMRTSAQQQAPIDEPIGIRELQPGDKTSQNTLVNIFDTRTPPRVVVDPPPTKRISDPHINPALLVHRVEPAFPPIAKQLHRNGRVELHALIATDGSVQSLQVVSGDPLFINSAKDAVLQWRYKPTLLNGQAVEVDTYITVIYTLQQ